MRAFLSAVLLLACQDVSDPSIADQCLRSQLFEACMKDLPAGPQKTHYNDWDDVVDSCETSAYYRSLRRESQVKPGCRP